MKRQAYTHVLLGHIRILHTSNAQFLPVRNKDEITQLWGIVTKWEDGGRGIRAVRVRNTDWFEYRMPSLFPQSVETVSKGAALLLDSCASSKPSFDQNQVWRC
jgi:hypothetical protein